MKPGHVSGYPILTEASEDEAESFEDFRSVHHAMDWDHERVNLAELEQDRQQRLDSEPYEHPYGDDDLDWWRHGR